jgi:hypothetical protein
MLILRGSRHVTSANEPLKFYTIRCVPLSNFFSSGSRQKSFKASSFVVIKAIVTDLVITGGIISVMALSRDVAMSYLRGISFITC